MEIIFEFMFLKSSNMYLDDHMLLDMATSAAAVGKMELARTHG